VEILFGFAFANPERLERKARRYNLRKPNPLLQIQNITILKSCDTIQKSVRVVTKSVTRTSAAQKM
jgi:hypothetical protein